MYVEKDNLVSWALNPDLEKLFRWISLIFLGDAGWTRQHKHRNVILLCVWGEVVDAIDWRDPHRFIGGWVFFK